MGRSTFEGPILSGDNRFGPQRDVGPVLLAQQAFLDFAVTSLPGPHRPSPRSPPCGGPGSGAAAGAGRAARRPR